MAVVSELANGQDEHNDALLRKEGFVRQREHHSPTSQYGQPSRRGAFDEYDIRTQLGESVGS